MPKPRCNWKPDTYKRHYRTTTKADLLKIIEDMEDEVLYFHVVTNRPGVAMRSVEIGKLDPR